MNLIKELETAEMARVLGDKKIPTFSPGDTLAVLEAMKMEHALAAPRDGVIEAIHSSAGQQVAEGDLLVSLVEE